MDKKEYIESLKNILDTHLQLPLNDLHSNTEYNLKNIEYNSKILVEQLIDQLNSLLQDTVVEGHEYDLFTKGAIIGGILALKDINYILNHEKRLKSS